MQVKLAEIIVADSNRVLEVAGDYYFPWKDVRRTYFVESDLRSYCAYKGWAIYWNIEVDGIVKLNAVFSYPQAAGAMAPLVEMAGFAANYDAGPRELRLLGETYRSIPPPAEGTGKVRSG